MKLSKLMLSAFVAAAALVACNKENTTPEVNRLKTVEVSLENVIHTKGLAGDKIVAGDPVQVNNFTVYLTDATRTTVYEAKVTNGSAAAQTHWTAEELAGGLPKEAQFHYVDPKCTKVIVVANAPEKEDKTPLTLEEAKALKLNIADQQDATDLVLYAEADVEAANRTHNDANADGTVYESDVYTAELTLKPCVARFEADGFNVTFSETPLFDEINITQMAFQNFYPEATIYNAANGFECKASGTPQLPVADALNVQADVYAWFNNTEKAEAWYWDAFDLTVTPEVNVADFEAPLAYHFFAGNLVPSVVIKLEADGQPAYIYTDTFMSKEKGAALTALEAGKIYRMVAAGSVANDGNVPFDDEDIDPMDRCIEITVKVVDWVVDLVTPEF